MIITKEIKIKVNSTGLKYYLDKGYDAKVGDELIIKTEDLTKSSAYKVVVKCDVCGEEKELVYNKYLKNIEKYNLYTCSNKCAHIKNKKTNLERHGIENYYNSEKSKETFLKNYGVDNPSKNKEIIQKISKIKKDYWINNLTKNFGVLNFKNDNNYELKCDCNKEHNFIIHRDLLHNRKQLKTVLCTICNPSKSYFVSGKEIQLQNFISDNYTDEILYSNRTIIYPNELDIYIPKLKLAFEFNGLFWHNEIKKENNYHLNKTDLCEKQGIQLIHIYEDDWMYKRDIVKSIILNKLGKITDKISETKIEEISDNELVIKFLNRNHIQGFVDSKIKIGLFNNNELVSLMIFDIIDNKYELLRFCNKLNTNIVDSSIKLFNYFIDNYKPKEIMALSDRSISQGKLYKKLGFKSQGKTESNYYYIIDGIRYNRFNFRKDVLIKEGFDINKTEHQIMLDRNIFRIYDSGNIKYNYV